MKICLIHNLWGNYARGGGERVLEYIATGLRERGDEVVIISTCPWAASVVAEQGLYYLGSGYHLLEKWPSPLRLLWHMGNVLNPIKYFQVKHILAHEKPDLIWTHNLTGFGFLLFTLAKKYRHIHSVHDIQLLHPSGLMLYGHEAIIQSPVARIYQSCLRGLISKTATAIFPSKWIEEVHLSNNFFSKNKRLVIANPQASIRKFPDLRLRKANNFLFVGQLEIHKGIELLLEAISTMNGVSLTVIGEGSLLKSLRTKYSGEQIKFTGRQDKAQVASQMQAADCLVVPSLCYENQPTVILEALACGLPVIASRLGGIPEILPATALFEPTLIAVKNKLHEVHSSVQSLNSDFKSMTVAEYIKKILS